MKTNCSLEMFEQYHVLETLLLILKAVYLFKAAFTLQD